MKKSLRERIYEKVKEDITLGKLAPGEHLVEERLAKGFKASRSPVREALRLLEAEGLIAFERNRGISVAKLSITQVKEIYVVRSLLESHAASIAAERIPEKAITRLKEFQEKQKIAASDVDLQGWLKWNEQFHKNLYDHCDNQVLIQMIDNMRRRVFRYRFITLSMPWAFKSYLEHHDKIIQGCEKKDGELAGKYTKLHMDLIKDELTNQLKFRGLGL
jgi:DNA-binding GntR family transcriptional regulator